MRSKIIVLSLVAFMGLVVWLFSPDQSEVVAKQKTEHAKSLGSNVPANTVVVVGDAPPPALVKKPAAAVIGFAKPVGSHQGPPVLFKRRDIASAPSTDLKTLARLKRGPGMELAGKKRRALAARAVPKDQDYSQVGTLATTFNSYNIVATDSTQDTNFANLPFHANARPVVENENGRLGVVTGTLVVKVEDSGAADRIAGQESFQLMHYDPQTQLAFFKVPDGYEIAPGAARLAKTAGVIRTEVEVFEKFKEAK